MIGLIKSENLKVFTTKVWWAMLIGLVGCVALALVVNGAIAASTLDEKSPDQSVQQLAANIYTSGQFFGLLFAAILGTLLVTNEFRHQTATSTFLATPKRVNVIIAKLITALSWGIIYALIATLLSLPVGIIFFNNENLDSQLAEGDVAKAIFFNLLAFGIWAVFGIGIGTLFRNQTGAVVTLIIVYFVTYIGSVVLIGLGSYLDNPAVTSIYFYLPYGATQVMTSVDKVSLGVGTGQTEGPAWWVGAFIVLLYGVVAAVVGTALTNKRDIS